MSYLDTQAVPYNYGSTRRGGFWKRWAAAFVDGILLGILNIALAAALHRDRGVADLAGLAIGLAYYTLLEGGTGGQTVGKRALGLRVVSIDTGGSIGYGRAFIRYWGRLVSLLVFGLGYLWMLWDREKQCWHDKFARDLVVPISDFPVYSQIRI
jgi:uncharacterized RDD family membrane protein YckC